LRATNAARPTPSYTRRERRVAQGGASAKIALARSDSSADGAEMDATRVATVMTPFHYSVDAREDLRTAYAMMKQHGIRHLPVMREGRLEGLVSERELEVALGVIGERDPDVQLPVWSVCRRQPYKVEIDATIADVADAMANQHIGSVLVTRKGKLAGIITTVDICRAFAELLRQRGSGPGPDRGPDVVA